MAGKVHAPKINSGGNIRDERLLSLGNMDLIIPILGLKKKYVSKAGSTEGGKGEGVHHRDAVHIIIVDFVGIMYFYTLPETFRKNIH